MSARGPRHQAKVDGRLTYSTGMPCKNGHVAERMTDSGSCIECRREGERARYALDPERFISKKQNFYKKNSESIKQKRREKYAKNPEAERDIARERSAEWRRKNPEKVRAQIKFKRAYQERNPEKVTALMAKRRAAKLHRTPKWLSPDDFWVMEQAYEIARERSKLFGFDWHVDHIFPLQGSDVSGLHVPWNLQVIPWYENLSKGNKPPSIDSGFEISAGLLKIG